MPDHPVPLAKASLASKFDLIHEHWKPKIIARVNDTHVKLVKFTGPFVWHHHDHEDEMFLVVKGRMIMELKGQEPLEMNEGDFLNVPHGIEHRPVVPDGVEAQVMMIEPATTVNTGSAGGERTTQAEWI